MPRTFDNGSWTSEYAADQAKAFKPKVDDEVKAHLLTRRELGATDQELEDALGRPGNTLRPSRVDLCKQGVVVDSGKWRFTRSRRPAKVWVLAQYAADAV